ncbi:MAG: family 1 encapsulin nanocompartment shell protein, partial [Acetobacterium sp.]|nr:family 1 encapsulin nanocompartment shell protein [Acetobacterium sp.]
MLKREIAPLTQLAWSEIDGRAEAVLKSRLTARKAVTVNGPKGLAFTSVSEGRLELIDDDENLVKTGIFKIKPLVEARISFTLNRWELDNLTRGAKDIDLTNLEEAVQKIAEFEETAVYKGFDAGQIKGLETVSANEKIPFGETDSQIMEAISKGLVTLKEKFEAGPFVLIVGEVAYNRLNISS